MTCREVERRLARENLEELTLDELDEIERHLESEEACFCFYSNPGSYRILELLLHILRRVIQLEDSDLAGTVYTLCGKKK